MALPTSKDLPDDLADPKASPNMKQGVGKNAEGSMEELQKRVLDLATKRSSIWIYKFVSFLVLFLGHKYFRVKINDAKNLNLANRLIIAPVHRSNLDAPLITSYCNRPIKSMAKVSMFRGKGLGGRLKTRISAAIGCIPVDRENIDRQSLKVCQQLLENDEALLIFPEGLRGSGTEVGSIFGGCALLAIRTQAPIVPIAISGTESAMPPGKKLPSRATIHIEVGELIYPPKSSTKSLRQDLTDRLHQEMQSLLDTANKKAS